MKGKSAIKMEEDELTGGEKGMPLNSKQRETGEWGGRGNVEEERMERKRATTCWKWGETMEEEVLGGGEGREEGLDGGWEGKGDKCGRGEAMGGKILEGK